MAMAHRIFLAVLLLSSPQAVNARQSWSQLMRGACPIRPECDGRVICTGYVSEQPDFLVNSNATEEGCAFGHIAADGSCDVPCTGVGHELCRCVSQEEAHSDSASIAMLILCFGVVFTLIGLCACTCASVELRRGAAGSEGRARGIEFRDLEVRSPIMQSSPAPARKQRVACALVLGLFFVVWLAFAGFLLTFGVWALFVHKSRYFNGCE